MRATMNEGQLVLGPSPTDRALSRRSLLCAAAGVMTVLSAVPPSRGAAPGAMPKLILLRTGWQSISIADLAQTAGDLALLERYLPAARVTVWPVHLDEPAEQMLRRRFPKLDVVRGHVDPKTGRPAEPELARAVERADLVLHGTGPFVVSPEALACARSARKPFGVLGVSLAEVDDRLAALLSNARFVFARETASLDLLKKANVDRPAVGVMPDSALALDARDDARAAAFLTSVGLADGGFLCCVPKLRYTPFRKQFPPDEVARRSAVSERFAEPDHAKMREAIVAWVRTTGRRVLVCPEMTYQLDLMDKLLLDPLPADVRPRVAKRDTFWLPDEAASVFARAAAVLSFELHAPLVALAAGTPAVHLRQPTDGRKGQVIRDVGLPDWVLEVDDATGEQVARTVLAIAADPAAAREKVRQSLAAAADRHAATLGVVRRTPD